MDAEKFYDTDKNLIPFYLSDIVSWHGHIAFAFWIIKRLRPSVFVELGVHKGDSFFAFCRANEKYHRKDERYYGIDNFVGDDHSGRYNEEIYHKVLALSNNFKYSFIYRLTFEEANKKFENNSISLLHIDGFHTYEAVKHDFETWLPKMKNDGVILFHDSTEKQTGFGVYKFVEELKEKYDKIRTFKHSHGLTVLSLGSNWINKLFDLTEEEFEEFGRYLEDHSKKICEAYQMLKR